MRKTFIELKSLESARVESRRTELTSTIRPSKPLVLSLQGLRRRAPASPRRTAALLGGARWLTRAWKRIARVARLRRVLEARVIFQRQHIRGTTRFQSFYRVDVFHAASMAFRF